MGRERDYGSEYHKSSNNYPRYKFRGGSKRIGKKVPRKQPEPLIPVDDDFYTPGEASAEADRVLAQPYTFPESKTTKQPQSQPQQPSPKRNWLGRLFGAGNEPSTQSDTSQTLKQKNASTPNKQHSNNRYAAPRSVNLNRQDSPAVENFQQRLRNRANSKLDENKQQVYQLSAAYNANDPKSKPLFNELRAVVTQDGQLEAQQKQLERELAVISNDPAMAGESPAMGGSIRVDPHSIAQLTTQLQQIKQVRATLLANYPVSGLIEAHQVGDDVSDAQIEDILTYRFAGINRDIDVAKEKISNGDIPLNELDALIPEILAQTPEGQRGEVEKYLKKQQRIDTAISVGGTLGEIGLTAGAIVSGILSGGVITTILAGLGTALGIGTATYEFERADDLNLIAKTGDAGGNQLLTQPDKAKQDYLLGWANLVLAGIDGGLAISEGASLLKGAKAAEQILGGGGADVIAQLKPEQIQRFNALVTAPDDVQAQKIYQSLQQELGKDFDTAYSLFARANQQVGGKTAHYKFLYWDKAIQNTDFPEYSHIQEMMRRNPSGGDELLEVELEKLRLNLLRNTQDLSNIYDVMRKSGLKVSREDIAAVKQYNFNSPGINFNPDNYESWIKLARGKGSIRDAHYLMHEIEEVKQLRKIQRETGFDFMGKDYFKMSRKEKNMWDAKFDIYYIKAHSKAVEHEYKFIASQITRFTDGAVKLDGKEDYLKLIFQEPKKKPRQDHIDNMQIDGTTLKNHLEADTSYYRKIQNDANESIQLPAHLAHLEQYIRNTFRVKEHKSIKIKHLIQWVRTQKLKQP